MQYRYIIMLAALFLVGCMAPSGRVSSPNRVAMTHSAYLGKSITLFILDNGTPYIHKQLKNGQHFYAWNSRRSGFDTSISRTAWDDERSDLMNSLCEVRIYTSSKGSIFSISAYNDVSKNWDADACTAYLK